MNRAKKSQLGEIQLQLTDLKNRLEAIHWELGEDIPVDQSLKIGKAVANLKTPPSIAESAEALAVYKDLMQYISVSLNKLDELKIPREDSALGLPLGMETKIVDKRNLRNLIDMSHQRMCTRAYHEYRRLFADIRKALSEYSPEWKYIVDHYLMPKCQHMGFCKERYICGMMPRRQVNGNG